MASKGTDTRSRRVRNIVRKAVGSWGEGVRSREEAGMAKGEHRNKESVLQSLPKRQQTIPPDERKQWIPPAETAPGKVPAGRSWLRSFTWLGVLLNVWAGNILDRVLRRDSVTREAVRFRQALERAGGTFVKVGQQLAMRVDLLPWAYCVELSKMLDRMAPFPFENALQAIDRTLGRPWQEVFQVIDPKPVGSASLACVYQAILKDGAKVVIKVRRPRIREIILADLQVLDWMAGLAEFLTIIRPGFTRKLRIELRDVLMEELDFRREARFQHIFRRNAKKDGWKFFNSPKVYFEHSGEEVLVQEFVSGLWLWELMHIVENKSPQGEAILREMNLDPKVIARRILKVTYWSYDENVFFHADPHPANILVRSNNELTFVDFGSCGSFNSQQRVAFEQMVLSMKNQDMDTMTRSILNLMGPFQPVDLPALIKYASEENLRVLHTFNTPAKYTEYWERTSARQWFVLIRTSQKFNLPMNIHMLRMIRSTLLYDSIVLRLDRRIDRYDEYVKFMKYRARFVNKRWRQNLRDNSGDNLFLNVEELGNSLNDILIRVQTLLNKPIVNFGSTVNKWVFAASVLGRVVVRILLVTLALVGLVEIIHVLAGTTPAWKDVWMAVLSNKFYWAFLVVALLFSIRLILFRLRDSN